MKCKLYSGAALVGRASTATVPNRVPSILLLVDSVNWFSTLPRPCEVKEWCFSVDDSRVLGSHYETPKAIISPKAVLRIYLAAIYKARSRARDKSTLKLGARPVFEASLDPGLAFCKGRLDFDW